ncbi:MAG: M14 metallopeptidase family protein [Flammeovirgaceae bacterium]
MKHLTLFQFLLLCLISLVSYGQVDLSYYLPKGVQYDESIPKPQDILGYQVGEWHASHDKLVYYMQTLAQRSDRVTIQEYGRTFENRPLQLLTITSTANQTKIDQIQKDHVALSDPSKSGELNTANMPAVVWAGYSVHGNEPSGSNAALLVAYHLAAAKGKEIDDLLNNVVILLDPCLNPDGFNRFANWVNMHKSKNLVTDPNSREYSEKWPRGRTNHYWFDLNRDWLPVQMPESRGRIAQFQAWKPNILTDHHEMGTNSTYFFQPGIPSRKNPLTPDKNVRLTEKIAKYHAKALDNIGSMYYSEESFDDFYYGKGSTYPDVQGAIGILFEQGSSRGHAQESIHGIVTFPFTILNQFTTSLSTLAAAKNLRKDLLDYQRDFYKNAVEEFKTQTVKAYVFGDAYDKSRNFHLVEMLKRHQIKVHQLAKDYQNIKKETGYIVPLNQPQNRLIQAIFRTQTEFTDSLFYDVSSWTLPYAFNIPYATVQGRDYTTDLLGESSKELTKPTGSVVGKDAKVGYAFRWDAYYAPRAAYQLMQKGLKLKVASKPFSAQVGQEVVDFDYGTVIIHQGIQKMAAGKLKDLVQQVAQENGIDFYTMETGLTPEGIDMGSRSFAMLRTPKVMIVGGRGATSYDVGEVWHLFDQRYDMPISIVEMSRLGAVDLGRYTTIVMVNGSYSGMQGNTLNKLRTWIREGGVLIGIKGGAQWAKNQGLAKINFKQGMPQDSTAYRPYAKHSNDLGAQRIGGAIFEAELDLSHPLGYGFHRNKIPVFRNSTRFAEKSRNPYATPLRYTDAPLLSGYISERNAAQLKNSAAILVNAYGQGRIISFIDNPNFRAFWYGTNKLFANAVFFGHTISSASAR